MGQQAGGLAITESQELELAAPAVGRNGRARREAVEDQVARIISQLDPLAAREGLIETPRRVARMYVDELCSGYDVDIAGLFRTFDHGGYDGMVIVRDIPVTSLCEHHLVPFVGYAHVGYIPNGRVIGLSKIARVVEAFARRLQLQERLTTEVADALERYLHASGVIVLVEAEHLCMTIRGVQKPGTKTVTSVVRGDFADCEQDSKEEFLRLVSRK